MRQLGFETLTDLVRVGVLGDEIESTTYLRIAVSPKGREALRNSLAEARQTLLHAHADDHWPSRSTIAGWLGRAPKLSETIKDLWHIEPRGTGYRVPVINAPIAAAIAAACGIAMDPPLIFELRYLRSFDEQWFDEAYSCTLAIAIGTLLDEDPRRIGME